MNVLVTGSSGFVGHAIVRKLCQTLPADCNIIATDKLENSYPKRCSFLQGELSNVLEHIRVATSSIIIIHCMVDIVSGDSINNIRTKNLDVFKSLVDFAINVNSPYLLMISSSSVVPSISKMPAKEEVSDKPKDAYGLVRFEMEQYISQYMKSNLSDLTCGVLRPHYVLGPNRSGIFTSLIEKMKKGKVILLPYSVRKPQQVLHIDDLVNFSLLFVATKRKGIYNIGANAEQPLYDYLIELHEYLKSRSKIFVLPLLATKLLTFLSDKLNLNMFGPNRHLVNDNGFELCNSKLIEHTGQSFNYSERIVWKDFITTLRK